MYSSSPLYMRPSYGDGTSGHIRGVAADEGLIENTFKGFVLKHCGHIRGVAAGESGRKRWDYCICTVLIEPGG